MFFKLLILQLGNVEDVLQTADTTAIECVEGVIQAADTTTGICGRCPSYCCYYNWDMWIVEGVLQTADTTTGICGRCPSNC